MSLLLETIRLEDGTFRLLAYHQQRMNYSRKVLLGYKSKIDLGKILLASTYEAKKEVERFYNAELFIQRKLNNLNSFHTIFHL